MSRLPSGPQVELEDLEVRAAAGELPTAAAITDPALGRLLATATDAGSPLLPALRAAHVAADDRAEIARGIRVATAQGRAVAAGLLALPLLLVPVLATLLDLELVAFYSRPPGVFVAVVGLALAGAGALCIRLLVARAERVGRVPADGAPSDDEVIDLVATAVGGAQPGGQACRLVAAHAPGRADVLQRMAFALELAQPTDLPAPFDRVHRTLERAGRSGAPAGPGLRRLAAAVRSERRTRALESAQRLPALLAFPTALCLLPATVLLVGAPLVAAGLAGVTGTP